MALRKPIEIFMSFVADENMLEDIRRSVNDAIVDVNIGNRERNGILLAIEEACTNVIRHAYLYGPGTIRIKIKIFPSKVVFSIFDKGRRFDFNRDDSLNLDRYVKTGRKGGLGLYLIRKIMDSVDYLSRDGENELRMVKNITPKKPVILKPRGVTIRLKFAMWASLVVFLIVSVIFFYYNNRNSSSIKERFFSEATNFAHTTALNSADKMVIGNELELAGLVSSALKGNPNLKYITIVDKSGLIWADALSPQKILSPYSYPSSVDSTVIDICQYYESEEHGRIYHLIMDITQNEQQLGKVHFGFSQSGLSQQLNRAERVMLILAILGLIVGLGAVHLLSYYFVKPIQKLTEGVLKIGQGNLEETLPVEGSDEFSEIARAFNEITLKFKAAQENIVEQERLQKEMQVAQDIQHALLPSRFPEIEGYELAAVYRAAKEVGGDYFDFVWIDKDALGIAVADVSGKGVPGSLVMTMIRTALRLEARDNHSPDDILARVNDFVAEDVKKGMFITIFFIILDSKNRQISFASAGHNPMILYRKDTGKCYFLNPKGIPLGLTLPDDVSFGGTIQTDKLKLKKDDMLVIYTDGITEAMNNRSEQYGNDRLINFIKENSHLSPDEFAAALDKDLVRFTGNAPQNDDITLVLIKEKIMVDELILEKRKRLLKMVEGEGVSVEEACKKMGVSLATFYKYRKRWKEHGDSGLLNKRLRAEVSIKHLPYNTRKMILDIVREKPEYGATRIQKILAEQEESYPVKNIYDELVNMRLNTRRRRLAYVERVGKLQPEQKEILEKEILREERKQLDRLQYIEDLKKSVESRQVKKITQETGRIISQLKQISPSIDGKNLYDEIAKELEKLEDGEEITRMFQSLIMKMDKDLAAPEDKIHEQAPAQKQIIKPIEAAGIRDEKINIEEKALKADDSKKVLKNFKEYERKLTEKFNK